MPSEKSSRYLMVAPAVIFLLLLFIPYPWSTITTPKGGEEIGLIHYEIKAELTPWLVRYNITASASGGALLGGGVEKRNITMEGERYYLKGGGSAQQDLGILYDSYKIKEGKLKIKAKEGFVNLTIGIEAESIPWYREGGSIGLKVWVRVEETEVAFSRIVVESVRITLKEDFSEEEKVYLKNRTFEYPVKGDNILTHPGDRLAWKYALNAPKGVGRIGITAMVNVNFQDSQGRGEDYMVPAQPNPINLYPIETTQLVSLAGVVLSGPLAIVGLILFSLPLVPKLEGKRWRWYLGGAGGVIAILSPLLFVSGVRTMGDLLSIRIKHAPDYISVTAMPYVVLGIGLLMLAVVIWQGYSEHKRRDEAGEKSGKERSKAVFRKIE